MSDIKFIDGLFFKEKHPNAPDFVIGGLSINVSKLKEFLAQAEGDWINANIKISRDGKPYIAIDDWKPDSSKAEKRPETPAPTEGIGEPDDLPF